MGTPSAGGMWRRRFSLAPLVVAAAGALASSASAQSVSMGGSLGSRALLVIDGKARTVAVGSTVDGVHLVSVSGNEAVVEMGGKRVVLQLGGAPANLGGGNSAGTGTQIVLTAQSGGHFVTSGTINGSTVRFFVDTGATNVILSAAEAEHVGIDFRKGQLGYSGTANGAVASYDVHLGSVRIGDVEVFNVDATVVPAALPYVLLGNSFLNRFQMRRENDRMTLDKRY